MKKLVFVSAVLLFATCVSAQGILLPPDAVVQPPAEAISANAKVFSGRWEGRWDERMPHVLVVEEIKSGFEAAVLYAWQEAPAPNSWSAGWYRTTAVIDGNTLRVPLRNGVKAWYEYQADGSLKASYLRPNSTTQNIAVLQKARP